MWTETGDLEDEGAVVVEEVVDLAEEGVVAAETDVLRPHEHSKSISTWGNAYLSHLERDDLGEVSAWVRDLAVVHAENSALLRGNTIIGQTLVSESGLVLAEGDTSDIAFVVLASESSEGSPSTSKCQRCPCQTEIFPLDKLHTQCQAGGR